MNVSLNLGVINTKQTKKLQLSSELPIQSKAVPATDTFQRTSFKGITRGTIPHHNLNRLDVENVSDGKNISNYGSIQIQDSKIGNVYSYRPDVSDYGQEAINRYNYFTREQCASTAEAYHREHNNYVSISNSEAKNINAYGVSLRDSKCKSIDAEDTVYLNDSSADSIVTKGWTVNCNNSMVNKVYSHERVDIDNSSITKIEAHCFTMRKSSRVNDVIIHSEEDNGQYVRIWDDSCQVYGKIEFKKYRGKVLVPREGLIKPSQVINGDIEIRKEKD